MKKIAIAVMLLIASVSVYAGDNGLISKKSKYSVTETIDRLEKALKEKGITIAMRWSHSDRANKVDIPLRPTELLVFGNPKLGSNFFTSKQTSGIDLPMKALAYEDEKGQVWLTYNDPQYIADRHGIDDRKEVVAKMSKALDNFSSVATGNK
ncbi:MAG: DUF302 domain-containing protein [Gammaproteobacteria bacterium]|jgi:uncharacterized protein (DUF302 family)|nr:DUF302 domain-containing protein [Gammaproteobacteria bacterium]